MAERFEIVEKALLSFLDDKKYSTLRDILVTMNPSDIAAIFDSLNESRIPLLFRLLPKELAAETFVEMEADAQELLIRGFSDNELKEVVDELYVDDAADLVEEMPANVVKRILKSADPEMRFAINQILRYEENSAGSIMTTEYVSLRPHMTVEEAILRIRRQGVDKETIYTCYVTDTQRKLLGTVTVKDLLLADDDEMRIMDIMFTNVIFATTSTDQEEVARMLSKYNFLAMPVVDAENRMVGIVTFDDAMDVMEDEAAEDIEKMAAMLPSEKPYLKTSVFELAKNRIPWLLFLMLSSTLSGAILTRYENAFAAIPLLVSFTPMLMNTGGNSGSQSSAMIIRGMSIGEIEPTDILSVIWKEVRVGLIAGSILAVANFIRLMIQYPGNTMISLVVVLSVFVTVVIAKSIGCTLPIAAKVLKMDPAIMAGPLITTIVDAVSLIVYFNLACMLLDMAV